MNKSCTDTHALEHSHNFAASTKTISGKEYIVKSVFLGNRDRDIKSTILKLAERKTIREMGLDVSLEFEKSNTS